MIKEMICSISLPTSQPSINPTSNPYRRVSLPMFRPKADGETTSLRKESLDGNTAAKDRDIEIREGIAKTKGSPSRAVDTFRRRARKAVGSKL